MTSPLVWIGVGILITVVGSGIGYFFMQADLAVPSPDGSIGQSPYVYVALLLLIGIMGVGLARVYNARNPERHFSLGLFLNVSIAGLLIGGIIHEGVHVLLLQHATQFRIHFGDAQAVFSTCCLLPGEYPFEEVAYGIQLLVTLGWIIAFRHAFIMPSHGEVTTPLLHGEKKTSSAPRPVKKAEEQMDDEWESQKKVMEHYLNPAREHPHHVSQRTHEEKELADLDKLKVRR